MEGVRAHQRAFLKALQQRTEPQVVVVNGVELTVNPGVFPPATDSLLIAENIKVSRGERILDLTTGCGTFAVIAGLQGATGIAGDINLEAVKNAAQNFARYNLRIRAVESNMFSRIPRQKFDLIVANGPYFETEEQIADPLEFAFYGAQRFHTILFGGLSKYLKAGGRVLVSFAEWGDLDMFERRARMNGFASEIIGKRTSADGQRTYRLYELRLPP